MSIWHRFEAKKDAPPKMHPSCFYCRLIAVVARRTLVARLVLRLILGIVLRSVLRSVLRTILRIVLGTVLRAVSALILSVCAILSRTLNISAVFAASSTILTIVFHNSLLFIMGHAAQDFGYSPIMRF